MTSTLDVRIEQQRACGYDVWETARRLGIRASDVREVWDRMDEIAEESPRTPGPPIPPCGTENGAKRHMRLGEPVDQACRDARNKARRERTERRKREREAS